MPHMPTLKNLGTPARLLFASTMAILAVAAPASALLGLPIALPSAGQHIDTAVGSADVSASEQGVDACYDLAAPALPIPAAPALPAVPSLPLPVPVAVPALPAVPAIPSTSAGTASCVSAGLDGASADISADAAGSHVGTGFEATSPVSEEQLASTIGEAQAAAGSTAAESTSFFDGLMDTLFGWM
ncbi:MAG TPA: hypothetical protein VM327_03925 [Candidatus Thermoplasmatota archaeon]|nr:hypothetical protein [Candidatus Thermoplasmatota archaeon]